MALKIPVNTSQLFYNAEGKLSIESISVSQVSGLSSLLDSKANSSAVASITSAQITDGSIADADISPSASIADSKLAPITTAGKVSGSAITSGTIGGSTVFNSSGNITAADITANGFLAAKTELRIGDADNSNYVGLKAPTTVTTNRIWTLPATDGANGQLLSTNGSGTLSWITAAGSGDMLASANLSDLANTTTARTNLGLGSLATKSTVASTDITDGTIVDADINAFAAIAQSKISGLATDLAAKQTAITTSSVVNSGTVTTALQNGVQIKPFNTAAGSTGELRFDELAANGANYVGFKAPDTLAADKIWTLPAADGTNGQILKTDGSGNLGWVTGAAGSVTSVNLTAPAAGITVSGGPITGAGSITLALGDDLAAVEGISTTGGVERTAANTWGTYNLTAAGKALIDDADATAQRTTLGLGGLATLSAVGSSEITNDSIMNTDINSAAAIATSKLSGAVTSITGHGLGGLATLSAVGSTEITNDSIMDTDINSAAAIADTKLATISTAGKVSGSAITSGTIGGSTVFNSSGAITTSAAITGTGNIIVNGTGSATTELRFNDNDNSNYVGFKAPATVSTNKLWTLPAADGTSGQVLKTDGSGALSWANGSGAMTGTGGGAAPNPSSGCPTGYILVPGDAAFSTTDFCVMKYEAKYGGQGTISQAIGIPARMHDQGRAASACRNLGPGYALINNNEWMTLATNAANVTTNWSSGTVGTGAINRGHSDNDHADALAAVTDDNDPCNGTGQTCSSSTWHDQRRTHVLSNSNVIWDLAGNVWEWVDYYNRDNKPTPATAAWYEFTAITGSTVMPKSMLVPTNAVKSWWSDSWNGATNGIGQMYPWAQNSGGALVRGGGWSDGTSSGLFAMSLYDDPAAASTGVGFRCVFRPSSP